MVPNCPKMNSSTLRRRSTTTSRNGQCTPRLLGELRTGVRPSRASWPHPWSNSHVSGVPRNARGLIHRDRSIPGHLSHFAARSCSATPAKPAARSDAAGGPPCISWCRGDRQADHEGLDRCLAGARNGCSEDLKQPADSRVHRVQQRRRIHAHGEDEHGQRYKRG